MLQMKRNLHYFPQRIRLEKIIPNFVVVKVRSKAVGVYVVVERVTVVGKNSGASIVVNVF